MEKASPAGGKMQSKENLKDGCILDERYRITRVIGEGGFGITYEAVNIHSGKKAAIKANRQGDPRRFLQEARTLRDFAEEPAIVSVIDYFEQDGTAYIVMEYLDGIPLSLAIRQNGKWPMEKAVRSFSPIMKTLEHIHQAGVIHRDISPDNLMLMPDGSLILMDFGAAKEIHEQNVTKTSIYKSVYSPPEQRESGITLGSYTDIYALAATIYFCVTGQEPEDALSRLLFDELKKPSECGAEIKPGSEKALLKALELDPDVRTQEIAELREQLEKDYPDLTEEEKKKKEEIRKQRGRIAIALCAILTLIILGMLYKFRTNILFTTIETQTVLLDGSGMTPENFRNNADIVRKRVEAFSGNRYLWKEDQGKIRFEVPSDLFADDAPSDVVRLSISRPMVISVSVKNEADQWENLGIFSQENDILSAKAGEDGIDVTLSRDAADRFEGRLDIPGTEVKLSFDADAGYDKWGYYPAAANGDGLSIHLSSDASDHDYLIPDKLKLLHLTTPPSTDAFPVQTEWKVRWEDVNSTLFPGKNQCNQNDVPNPSILVRYEPHGEKENFPGYNLAEVSFQAALKNRLDSLDFPYAVGMDKYEKNVYVVKLPTERYWYEEISYLTEIGRYNLSYGSSKTKTTEHPDSIKLLTNSDGTWQIADEISTYNRESQQKLLEALSQQGETDLYLYYYDTPLFVCRLDDAAETLQENGTIRFTRWLSAEYPEMDDTTKHFGSFLEACSNQKLPSDINYQSGHIVEHHDEKGAIVTSDQNINVPPSLTDNKAILNLISEWNRIYAGKLRFTYNIDVDKRYLRITALNAEINDPAAALQTIESVFAENSEVFKSGDFQTIYIYVLPDNEPIFTWVSTSDPGKPLINLTLFMDFESGKLLFAKYIPFATYYHIENSEEMETSYNEYFRSSPVWQQFIRPDTEKTTP